MKCAQLLALTAMAVVPVALVSCDSLNRPLGGSDAYNPLDAPAGEVAPPQEDPYVPSYSPGTYLQTASSNTSFFTKFPKGRDQPAKTLPRSTDVKVVSTKGSYVKVEVVDTGEVGYVPSVMLGEKRQPKQIPSTPGADSVPETPGMTPVPEVPDVPAVVPDPEIPGLGPPEVVDPSRPAE